MPCLWVELCAHVVCVGHQAGQDEVFALQGAIAEEPEGGEAQAEIRVGNALTELGCRRLYGHCCANSPSKIMWYYLNFTHEEMCSEKLGNYPSATQIGSGRILTIVELSGAGSQTPYTPLPPSPYCLLVSFSCVVSSSEPQGVHHTEKPRTSPFKDLQHKTPRT